MKRKFSIANFISQLGDVTESKLLKENFIESEKTSGFIYLYNEVFKKAIADESLPINLDITAFDDDDLTDIENFAEEYEKSLDDAYSVAKIFDKANAVPSAASFI